MVGLAGGFGKAIPGCEPEDPMAGGLQTDPVANGDIQGLDIVLGTEDGADHLVAIGQKSVISPGRPGIFRFADEPGLAATDGRNVKENPKMAG